jgi:hypothetical protein
MRRWPTLLIFVSTAITTQKQHFRFRKICPTFELGTFAPIFKMDKLCIPDITSLLNLQCFCLRDISEDLSTSTKTEPGIGVSLTGTIFWY